MSGWPDKPGVPLNPERTDWHWISNGREFPAIWLSGTNGWLGAGSSITAQTAAKRGWCYLGPCLTPDELAAREAAAFKRGAEAMREKAAREIECGCSAAFREKVVALPPNSADRWNLCGSTHCPAIDAAAIRALPVPEDKA